MKNLLTVVGDGNAGFVLDAAWRVAQRFNSHIVGLHSLTTEYAVVFGGEMGFSISSEVDRTLEREGHERRDQARRLFSDFMNAHGVPIGPPNPGYNGPSASWREEDGRPNAVGGMTGRVYDLILVEQPEKLASIAEATLEDALFESGRPVLMVPKVTGTPLGEVVAIAWNGSTETAVTVAMGMPFLQQAREVVIVAVGPQHMPEPGPTAVFDRSGSVESVKLLEAFENSEYFDIRYRVRSARGLTRMIDDGIAKVGIVIPPDYARRLSRRAAEIQVVVDASDPQVATSAMSAAVISIT